MKNFLRLIHLQIVHLALVPGIDGSKVDLALNSCTIPAVDLTQLSRDHLNSYFSGLGARHYDQRPINQSKCRAAMLTRQRRK